MRRSLRGILILLALLSIGGIHKLQAQIVVKGTVYNMTRTRPLEAVSVTTTSHHGTYTDSNGNYAIQVVETDSISFSYLGRSTVKYPVSGILNINGFDIALHVQATELKEVRVAPRNYHMDSLQNRIDYAKGFEFRKPGLGIAEPTAGNGLGVGLDLDQLINVFRFQRTRRMIAFQRRLIEDEQEKFIDHRFNRSSVRKVTGLEGDQLDSFMVKYRPSYEFTKTANDYDFFDYIKLAFEEYTGRAIPTNNLKREDEVKP